MGYQDKQKNNDYHKSYREQNRLTLREYQKQWYQKNKQKYTGKILALRLEMIAAYGSQCQCCGESEPAFLSIDHVDGLGYKPKLKNGTRVGGWRFYFWLKQNGWPKEHYRLLCMNCNTAIGNWGTCPHASKVLAQISA